MNDRNHTKKEKKTATIARNKVSERRAIIRMEMQYVQQMMERKSDNQSITMQKINRKKNRKNRKWETKMTRTNQKATSNKRNREKKIK